MAKTAKAKSTQVNGSNGHSNGHGFSGKFDHEYDIPGLIDVQRESFEWFLEEGIKELLEEMSPIKDFTGERFEMSYGKFEILDPPYSESECKEREITYSVPLHVNVGLDIRHRDTDEKTSQPLFFGDIPRMTKNGTFIINGAERVIISQLVRSPGAYYSVTYDKSTGNPLASAKVIPYTGAWIELETSNRDGLFAKVDRKRKVAITSFLRAISAVEDGTLADRYLGRDHSDRFANDLQRELYERLTSDGYRAAPNVDLNPRDQVVPDDRLRGDIAIFGSNGAEIVVMFDQDPSDNEDAAAEDDARYELLTEDGLEVYRICGADWYASDSSRTKTYKKLTAACETAGIGAWSEPWGIGAWNSLATLKALLPEPEGDEDGLQRSFVEDTWMRDTECAEEESALKELHHRLRPGELPTAEGAKDMIRATFLERKKYDLGDVGRHKLNQTLGLNVSARTKTLTKWDVIGLVRRLIAVNRSQAEPDDIDNLKNRRVRTVGELIKNQLRIGLTRMERVVRDRMTTHPSDGRMTPASLINIRPIAAVIKEFFGGSQLSQFMDQTNPLSELTHKRRLSALGPGGLTRDRAGFDVRDVHYSHYGRICPIETPEGPNIGLLGSLATYAKVNRHGFIETPYRKVRKTISNKSAPEDVIGRTLTGVVIEKSRQTVKAVAGDTISEPLYKELHRLGEQELPVRAYITDDDADVEYLDAHVESVKNIGEPVVPVNALGELPAEVACRTADELYIEAPAGDVDYIDVSPRQTVSVSTGLIPFLEHDDATRALMGSNMQRQGVPLLLPQKPIVATGLETKAAKDSGQVAMADADGYVTSATADSVEVTTEEGESHRIPLVKFARTNQSTCFDQHPIVKKGQRVKAGQPLADSSSTDGGSLALGQNLLVGFMSWGGGNFEDAIILNEDLVKHDRYTSIHIEKREIEARETKLGDEEITRDIPNVGDQKLANLDENGVVVEGTWIGQGDILVGKISPKGETELTAEEKLLRAIFGEKARDVKDSSLKARHGEKGKVIKVTVTDREQDTDRELLPGIIKLVRVWFAHTRKITLGDKMAGRHGNKGVVAMILPREDMPYLADGTPLDVVLNPIGVPSRMNLGQLLETHLGWAMRSLGLESEEPVFASPTDVEIEDFIARAWFAMESGAIDPVALNNGHVDENIAKNWLAERELDFDAIWNKHKEAANVGVASEACLKMWLKENTSDKTASEIDAMPRGDLIELARQIDREQSKAAPILGKQQLYDGRTGETFDQPVTVGSIYMMKLSHLAEDKIHARSVGPYSLITQQPLGGKAQFGGQRLGEMEVWALEAYSAPHILQEMLTIKSDDRTGRIMAYESIVKGEPMAPVDLPESFNVLHRELQALALDFRLRDDPKVAMESEDEKEEDDALEEDQKAFNVNDPEARLPLPTRPGPEDSMFERVPDEDEDETDGLSEDSPDDADSSGKSRTNGSP